MSDITTEEATALDYETTYSLSYKERSLNDALKTVIRISRAINPKNSKLEINALEIYNVNINLNIMNLTLDSQRFKPSLKMLLMLLMHLI